MKMKSTLRLIFLSCVIISCERNASIKKNITNVNDTSAVTLKNKSDSISYYTGIFTVSNLKEQGADNLNTDAFYKGIEDAFNGQNPMTKADVDYLIGFYFKKISDERNKELIQEEKLFFVNNKIRKEIITTPTGLQYELMREGSGPVPTDADKVVVHDIGSTIRGEEFVNSYKSNLPDTFSLGDQNLPGLSEAFRLMPVGSKYKFFIPSELGFGSNPPPIGDLRPNMSLIFEIEMLSILKPPSKNH